MALLGFVKSIQLLTRTCEDFDRIGFDNVQNKSGSGKDKAKNRLKAIDPASFLSVT